MSALAAILLDAASSLAVPVIKRILAEKLGGQVGDIAGKVIDAIAEKAGVAPEALPGLPAEQMQEALVAAEPVAADILVQHVESQRLANELMQAELDKGGPLWTWGWRPMWMWLLAALWTYALMGRPLANAAFGWSIEALDTGVLMTVTTVYVGLYMGGHTIKDIAAKWAEK